MAVAPEDARLAQAGHTPSWLLLPVDFESPAWRVRRLGRDDAGLHRLFNAIDPDDEAGMLAFGGEYGLLRSVELVDVTAYAPGQVIWSADRIET